MRRKTKNAIRIAKREAFLSSSIDYKHSAILMNAGKIICRSHNFSCHPPVLSSNVNHAEERVLRRGKRLGITGETLIIVRITKTGMFAESKPCPKCFASILEHEIQNVFYSCGKTRSIIPLILNGKIV